MGRLKSLGVTVVTLFALGGITSASASAALPNFLPLGTEANPVTFTAKSGKGTLETVGKTKIECEKDTGSGSVTSEKLGKFTTKFEGCKEPKNGLTCTGLADKVAGNITTSGTFHVKRLLPEATHVYIAFLPEHTHFNCEAGIIKILILVLGCAAGLLLSPNILTKQLVIHLKQKEGIQEPTEYSNDEVTKDEKCSLTTKVGAEAEQQSGELAEEEVENFEQNKVKVEALVMA